MMWLGRVKNAFFALFRAVMDLIAAFLGSYYSAKYAVLARRLGLPRVAVDGRRGFIIIQIDGLSYDHLLEAMARGYAPTLQRLVRRQELRLHPWKPGLPGNTPAVQAGILFGDNDEIPAYRWYDKAARRSIVCSVPSVAQELQERLAQNGPGILRGGSSHMNIFDGDASLSMFTLGSLGRHRFFESIRGMGFFVLFLLNPLRSIRVLFLALWEYLMDLVQRTHATLKRATPRPFGRMFPFLRVMSNVVLREIQTFSVLLDIYRGVPALYTTYFGYDELAHHYGPLSKPALRALRAIDAAIHRIDHFRRLGISRLYDLYILSDHGMTEATPFTWQFHRTVGELVQEMMGESIALSETLGIPRQDLMQALYVHEELQAIEENVRPPFSRIPQWLRKFVAQRLPIDLGEGDQPTDHTELIVRNSGSLSHVYFGTHEKQLDLSEVIYLYPSLVSSLIAHPGIWLVVGRERGHAVILSKEGMITLENGYQVEGVDPLRVVPYARWAARQLERIALFRSSGDLILMGYYDPDTARACGFEEQWACHGGLGGPQDMAFLMVEPGVPWDLVTVRQATDIYRLFTQRYSAS